MLFHKKNELDTLRYLITNMNISNKQSVTKIKRIFFILSAIIAISALVLFLLDKIMWALIAVGIFSLWYLFFHVADYQLIEFSDDNDKIILRYYKAISFGGRNYSSIEFPKNILRKAHFDNSVFGKLSDLTFIIKTKRGIAEYPSVSLSAVPFKDRKRIKESLENMLNK